MPTLTTAPAGLPQQATPPNPAPANLPKVVTLTAAGSKQDETPMKVHDYTKTQWLKEKKSDHKLS